MKTAILVIGFNRADLLSKLLASINKEERDVYIFIDGARNPIENFEVEKCRTLATHYQNQNAIKRTIHLNFQINNLGCKIAVRSAIDWAFESETKLIILEDDILIGKSFLKTMDVWLDRYSDEKKIFHLNGFSPIPRQFESAASFLSRYPHVWGWATWRDRWITYDRDLSQWEDGKLHLLPGLKNQFLPENFTEYWDTQIKLCIAGYDTWDVQWTFSQWVSGGFSLTPGARLTGNVGFDNRATHTKSAGNPNRSMRPNDKTYLSDLKKMPVFNHELNAMQDFVEHNLGYSLNRNRWKMYVAGLVQNPILREMLVKFVNFLIKFREHKIYRFLDSFFKTISRNVPTFVQLYLKLFFRAKDPLYLLIRQKFKLGARICKLIYYKFFIRGIKFIYWRGLRRFLIKR
jgi:hypothetical protein